MRWIADDLELSNILGKVRRLPNSAEVTTGLPLTKLTFDDAVLSTSSFFGLLLLLMRHPGFSSKRLLILNHCQRECRYCYCLLANPETASVRNRIADFDNITASNHVKSTHLPALKSTQIRTLAKRKIRPR